LPLEVSQLPTVLLSATDVRIAGSPQLKDNFAATVSHELRAPLTSISGALGLLINGADKSLSRPMMRLLTIAHNSSQKLVRLVNSILDDEKIESDKTVFVPKRVEFFSLAWQTTEADRGFDDTSGGRFGFESVSADAATHALVGRTVADVELDLILATLKQCLGNRTHAASMLGISIRTLRNKLNAYTAEGLTVPPPGGGDMHVTHRERSAQMRNSSRRARVLHRAERRHAVL
jgi:hypothetical protein